MDTFQKLDDYFKSAKTWSDDHYCRVKKSRHRYQVAFLTAMGLNLIILIAIGILVSRLVNTLPNAVVPAQAGIHSYVGTGATEEMDPRLRGDDNNEANLQDEVLAF